MQWDCFSMEQVVANLSSATKGNNSQCRGGSAATGRSHGLPPHGTGFATSSRRRRTKEHTEVYVPPNLRGRTENKSQAIPTGQGPQRIVTCFCCSPPGTAGKEVASLQLKRPQRIYFIVFTALLVGTCSYTVVSIVKAREVPDARPTWANRMLTTTSHINSLRNSRKGGVHELSRIASAGHGIPPLKIGFATQLLARMPNSHCHHSP